MARERKSKNGKYLRNGKELKIPTPASPIREVADIVKIQQVLKGELILEDKNGKRIKTPHKKYWLLFELSVGIGLRIQDTLSLTVDEVLKEQDKYEMKTGKKRQIVLNDRLRKVVEDYVSEFDLKGSDKLIFANRKDGTKNEAIDKSQAYRKLKEIVETVCPHVRFSNHTTRKTWAYRLYIKEDKNVAIVQKTLGHSSSLITLDYIGQSREEIREKLVSFDPFEE